MTDKYINGLDKVYERLLSKYKGKQISLLEIGVLNGGSMIMFEGMLPDAKIYGFDILPRPPCLNGSKIITSIINQNDTESIEAFATKADGFDVVIDDGSHFTKETKNCFDALWKYVKRGGLYVIEDWAVSLAIGFPYFENFRTKVIEMDKLVYDIASRKIELGISSIEIIFKGNQSYVAYGK